MALMYCRKCKEIKSHNGKGELGKGKHYVCKDCGAVKNVSGY